MGKMETTAPCGVVPKTFEPTIRFGFIVNFRTHPQEKSDVNAPKIVLPTPVRIAVMSCFLKKKYQYILYFVALILMVSTNKMLKIYFFHEKITLNVSCKNETLHLIVGNFLYLTHALIRHFTH